MKHTVFCKKLQKEAPGLERVPFPSALGERIYAEISKEAFSLWLKQQTILINENRLNLADPKTREKLNEAMTHFLFGENES